MLLLVTSDDLGEGSELAPQGAFRTGLGVERGLDVLKEQDEVENSHVLRGRRR